MPYAQEEEEQEKLPNKTEGEQEEEQGPPAAGALQPRAPEVKADASVAEPAVSDEVANEGGRGSIMREECGRGRAGKEGKK